VTKGNPTRSSQGFYVGKKHTKVAILEETNYATLHNVILFKGKENATLEFLTV
jgi:hypothetical protein